jgi:O-antigen ligase
MVLLLVVVAGLLLNTPSRRSGAFRAVAWAGLLAPLAVTQARTQADIQTSPLTPLVLAEGLATVAALGIVMIVARPRLWPLSSPERWLAGFLGVSLVSTLWSIAPVPTFLWAANLTVVYVLLVLLMRLQRDSGVDPMAELSRVVHLLLGATLIGLLLAPSAAMSEPFQYSLVRRLGGVFPRIDPNSLGFLCAVGIVLVIAGYGPLTKSAKRLNSGVIVIDGALLLLSRSRTPLVLLAFGLAVWYAQRRGGWTVLLASIAIAMVGFIVLAGAGHSVVSYTLREQSTQNVTTLTGRTQEWAAALDAFERRPLEGFGFYSGHRLGLENLGVNQTSNLDSLWFESMVDVGIIGLVALSGLILTAGTRLFSRRSYALFGAGCVRWPLFLMSLISSFLDPSLQRPSYFLLVFGVVLFAPLPHARRPCASSVTRPASTSTATVE